MNEIYYLHQFMLTNKIDYLKMEDKENIFYKLSNFEDKEKVEEYLKTTSLNYSWKAITLTIRAYFPKEDLNDKEDLNELYCLQKLIIKNNMYHIKEEDREYIYYHLDSVENRQILEEYLQTTSLNYSWDATTLKIKTFDYNKYYKNYPQKCFKTCIFK